MDEKSDLKAFLLAATSAAAVLMSIAVSQFLLVVACLYWAYKRCRTITWPSYFVPLAAFLIATLLSVVASPDPEAGIWSLRKFWLFSMGLLAANFVTNTWRMKIAHRLLLFVACAAALAGIAQFAVGYWRFLQTGLLADDPTVLARITGLNGHWMTFSGGLLLVWCAGIPALMALGQKWIPPAFVIGAAIILSFTRSVWLGAAMGFGLAAFSLPRRMLAMVVIPLVIVAIAGSGLIYKRISMSLEGGFGPDEARLHYLRTGSRMIQDHPVFGVGPERVDDEFPRYFQGTKLPEYYGHLHNNVLQIAAERGLICLATFFWFVFELYRSLFQVWKTSDESHRWIALSAVAALSGFLVAGLFEYNFGDSEVLLLLLFIVSAPLGMRDLYSQLDVQEGSGR